MKEYKSLNHMEEVQSDEEMKEDKTKITYYLPHHAVLKPTSTTTKLRVVFNASHKTSSGLSLNDALMVGPQVQQTLFEIVLRFRKHRIAITGDITKMYRQIEIYTEQRGLQRIFWRSDPSEAVQTYQLTTVTYGTGCAPYLATRTLLQVARDEAVEFPKAAERVKGDFYVDDFISGANSVTEAKELRKQVTSMLEKAQFELRKWSSNSEEVLADILQESRSSKSETTCALGLTWCPSSDEFVVTIGACAETRLVTKRIVLSDIARLYDPLGLCGPVIFLAKVFLQRLWTIPRLNWDDELSEPYQQEWVMLRNELKELSEIRIPRCVVSAQCVDRFELIGFSDASEKGYAACVYVRSLIGQKVVSVRLLCAKSRVAPLKKLTMPRLELCGALLLAQLLDKALTALEMRIHYRTFWTDSEIVLAYIRSSPSRFPTFVANKIAQIQSLSEPSEWRHVRSNENPADILSRGMFPAELNSCDMWWNGPSFLRNNNFIEEVMENCISEHELPEFRANLVSLNVIQDTRNSLFNRFSSYTKLLRVVAWCNRFFHNSLKSKNKELRQGPLSVNEIQEAKERIIRNLQQVDFALEFTQLANGQCVNQKSKLRSLAPFMDDKGVIRVGGRLNNSMLSYESKHPVVLLATNHVSKLIVRYEHLRNLHAAPQALMNTVRQTYWILGLRNLAKAVVRQCITCFKMKPQSTEQLMGQLPAARVQVAPVFSQVGIDYCGPFSIKYRVRTRVSFKVYICVFICLTTKAVHLEIVEDLTTEAFLSTLRRFISRRGLNHRIYSDNPTTFIGANNQLQELKRMLSQGKHVEKVDHFCTERNIQWLFIPPRSPHHGEIWESAVKSAKYHLYRVMGTTTLTIGEFHTLVVEVESCLNSRPISAMSEDPSDLMPLTPGHFLIGQPLRALPEENLKDIPANRLTRWNLVQQKVQHFWDRWSKDYLNQLNQRVKWQYAKKNVRVGNLVLLRDPNTPPMCWIIGRILEIHPGADEAVRVATVKTSKGQYKRAINQICIIRDAEF